MHTERVTFRIPKDELLEAEEARIELGLDSLSDLIRNALERQREKHSIGTKTYSGDLHYSGA